MSHWELRNIPIKFQLSDWVLFSTPLLLQCRSISIMEPALSLTELPLPYSELSGDCQGFMIRALPVVDQLPQIQQQDGYLYYVPSQYQHCYIDFAMTFDEYQKKFSSKTRSTINRKIKKFAEHCGGSLHWKSYQSVPEVRAFFHQARIVSVLTYQERLLDAGIPESEDFIQEAEALAAQDQLRAFILFDGDQPVSYLYCPVQNDVLIYAYLGYNPEYMKLSVGTVLQWLALEQLFNEAKFKAFDFTEGESDHKRLFATHQIRCANVFVIKNSVKNKLVIYGHRFIDLFSHWLGITLDKLGLKSKIKRLLRFAGQ